jgi:hypothetical protein
MAGIKDIAQGGAGPDATHDTFQMQHSFYDCYCDAEICLFQQAFTGLQRAGVMCFPLPDFPSVSISSQSFAQLALDESVFAAFLAELEESRGGAFFSLPLLLLKMVSATKVRKALLSYRSCAYPRPPLTT